MSFKYVFSKNTYSGHRKRVAILLSSTINYEHISEFKDKKGRFVLITGKMEGILMSFFKIYVPPGSKWSFYEQIFEIMMTKSQGILICGGDFNMCLNPRLDSSSRRSELEGISKIRLFLHL